MKNFDKVFDLRRAGARQAAQHPLLKGLTEVGRGAFSVVYKDGPSVLKMTVDETPGKLLQAAEGKFRCLPILLEDYGVIGELKAGIPIRLLRLERLESLRRRTNAWRTASRLCAVVKQSDNDIWFSGMKKDFTHLKVVDSAMGQLQAIDGVSPDLLSALRFIGEFTLGTSYGLDLTINNVMLRGWTNELVLADPIADYNAYDGL